MADIRLDYLLAELRAGQRQLNDDLPVYSEDEMATGGSSLSERVWSWDATRAIVGSCRDDLRIVNRFSHLHIAEVVICWDDFLGWMYQLIYSDGRKLMAPLVGLTDECTHKSLVKAMLWLLREHGIECTRQDLEHHVDWIRYVEPQGGALGWSLRVEP